MGSRIVFLMDKVLIVNHDPEMQESLQEGLQRYTNQFEIVSTTDGSEAIDILGKEKISLVVIDLLLPGIGGLQIIAYMSRNYSNIPCIVMIEPSVNPDIRNYLLSKNILRAIDKPVNYKILASAIIESLDLLDEGSTNQGISVFSFFSLIQLKAETCLIQIKFPTNIRTYVYFEKGILFDASSNTGKESEAAILDILERENAEFSFLSLPKGEIQQKIYPDLITLLEETNQRKLEPITADDEESLPEKRETEVFIQGHPVSVDIEEDIFVEISPGKNTSVKDKLGEITEITGFIAAGIFSVGGDLLEGITNKPLKLERIVDYIFGILKNTRKIFRVLQLGEIDILDISTATGAHLLIKGYMKGDLNFLVMILCDQHAQLDFFRQWLEVAVVNLSEDLKPC
jgi:CheY-like chemotaxis protein